MLAALSLAELFVLTPWFSASAVLPALAREWQLDDAGRAGLTVAVQLGFILGYGAPENAARIGPDGAGRR